MERIAFPASFALILGVVALCQPLHAQESDELSIEKLTGKQIYTFFCARCHGEDGKGNIDPEIIAGMEAPPPDFTDPYFSSREKRKDWKAVITSGGAARGLSMSMPSWGHVLTEEQINETVEYIKGFVEQDRYPQGELNFIRGHHTTKAFVEQEALLIPTYQTKRLAKGSSVETKITLYYANRFGDRFQYELKLPIHQRVFNTTRSSGIGDAQIGSKYVLYDNYKSMTILSTGIEVTAPTGSVEKGFGVGNMVFTPTVAVGQWIAEMVQLSGSVKIETPVNTQTNQPELRVSLLSVVTLDESKQGVFPGLEVSFKKNLSNAQQSVSFVPQLFWGITPRGHLALSIGAELPIGGARTFDRRFVAFLLWDYVDGGLWW
jgi:cytochrome c oxidase cbb3-type subunit 3